VGKRLLVGENSFNSQISFDTQRVFNITIKFGKFHGEVEVNGNDLSLLTHGSCKMDPQKIAIWPIGVLSEHYHKEKRMLNMSASKAAMHGH